MRADGGRRLGPDDGGGHGVRWLRVSTAPSQIAPRNVLNHLAASNAVGIDPRVIDADVVEPTHWAIIDTVFVDRDGVINVNRPGYVGSWQEFEFLPGALDALALLASNGLRVVVVTNQACVGRSLLDKAELDAIHSRMIEAVKAHGGDIAAVLACPHVPEQRCGCRKPAPGLLNEACTYFGIAPATTVLIGDHLTDLEAAQQAGARSILVLSGRTDAWMNPELPESCIAVLPDLWSAANYLVSAAAGLLVPVETMMNVLDLPDPLDRSEPLTLFDAATTAVHPSSS